MNRFFSFLLSQRERAARAVPWLGLLIFALTGTLGVFLGGSYASLGIGGGLLLFGAVWMADGRAPKPHGVLAGFCFFFLLVCAALDLQAMDKWLAWKETLRLATILLPLLLLSCPAVQARAAQADVFKYAAIAAALGMFALGAELFSGTPLFEMDERLGRFRRKGRHEIQPRFLLCGSLSWPFMASLWAEPKRRWTVAPFSCHAFAAYLDAVTRDTVRVRYGSRCFCRRLAGADGCALGAGAVGGAGYGVAVCGASHV